MKITLCNRSSDICEDFADAEYLVSISGADIYVDNNLFGYYFSAWRSEFPSHIDIVITALTENGQNSLAVVCTYDISKRAFVSESLDSLYLDSEWREQNNVVADAEIKDYSQAREARSMAAHILNHDEHLAELIRD